MPFPPSLNVGTGRQQDTLAEYEEKVAEAARRKRKRQANVTPEQLANLKPNQSTGTITRKHWPTPERRCKHVSKKTGNQCKNWSLHGATRCHKHGGYRQNPSHPGSIKLYEKGAIAAEAENRAAATELLSHPHKQDAINALRAAEAPTRHTDVLELANALQIDDNGKTYRAILSRIIQEKGKKCR
jgi:hypothetical protein